MADGILTPCNVACGSEIVTVNSPSAACNVIRGSGMTCHWIRPNVRHIGILHLVSISTYHRSRHDLYQSAKFYPHRTKSSYTTSYRSSIDIIALNCLVFEKISFFAFWRQTDRQTDKQMDIIDAWSRSLAIASCGLIIVQITFHGV